MNKRAMRSVRKRERRPHVLAVTKYVSDPKEVRSLGGLDICTSAPEGFFLDNSSARLEAVPSRLLSQALDPVCEG